LAFVGVLASLVLARFQVGQRPNRRQRVGQWLPDPVIARDEYRDPNSAPESFHVTGWSLSTHIAGRST
jgi:hypothetical protein